MFNSTRLTVARKRRRMTGKDLAERSGLSAMTISRLENGENLPDDSTVSKLATALEFPEEFFFARDIDAVSTDAVSFRSLTKMSAKERDAAISAGMLGLELSNWIEARFSLPHPNLLDLSSESDPEASARSLRQHWGIGERPIGNMVGLLETHGVRVFSLSENTASVDAFSFWRDEKPFVFLNNFKTAERSILDAAHELGHLVMHRHAGPNPDRVENDDRATEREANAFASAFLMPEADVRSRMPRFIDADAVIRLKVRWRVSAMAMAYRLHSLRIISEWQYKTLCIELGKRGYRSGEPVGIERETSIVWKKVLSQLWSERVSKNEIARELHIPLDELEGLIWELSGQRRVTAPKRTTLRTV
jgi:Zn-dependent peptidase ImmA (M78 family)/transcriptional regulator with XRE-family HTH domain